MVKNLYGIRQRFSKAGYPLDIGMGTGMVWDGLGLWNQKATRHMGARCGSRWVNLGLSPIFFVMPAFDAIPKPYHYDGITQEVLFVANDDTILFHVVFDHYVGAFRDHGPTSSVTI